MWTPELLLFPPFPIISSFSVEGRVGWEKGTPLTLGTHISHQNVLTKATSSCKGCWEM